MGKNKTWLIIGLCGLTGLIHSTAFAWGGSYHHRGSHWYRHGWFGLDVVVAAPPLGTLVTTLPGGYTTVVVGGAPYYYYDNVYYRRGPSGYVVIPAPVAAPTSVVEPPVLVSQTPVAAGDTATINVPNSNGSYTPVTLVKRGNGYVGPQGEFYAGNPTVEQLKALYGK